MQNCIGLGFESDLTCVKPLFAFFKNDRTFLESQMCNLLLGTVGLRSRRIVVTGLPLHWLTIRTGMEVQNKIEHITNPGIYNKNRVSAFRKVHFLIYW